METRDIIAECGLTGNDMAEAARTMSMKLMQAEREGNKGPGAQRGPASMRGTLEENWGVVSRFCKAGALLGNSDCMCIMAEIFYGRKSEEAKKSVDTLKEAVEWWKKAAEAGNGRGATNLGLLYMGKEIPGAGSFGTLDYNAEEALKYFIKGYELGDMKAGRHVGLCYMEGKGTEKDPKAAFEWFQKAAARGDSSAALYIADCKLDGVGTEQDIDGAIKDYVALVECKGHDVTNAAYKLACIYRDGKYVPKDADKSCEYFESVIRTATPREADLKAEAQKAIGA